MKFKKISIEREATQWFKNGDHPQDGQEAFLREGKIVRYYRNPKVDGGAKCDRCLDIMCNHGWIDTLQGGHIVCPGDWIITEITGEYYPCKSDIFALTYEKI